MTRAAATALQHQHAAIDADLRARSLRSAVELTRHWVTESRQMLPADETCALYAHAAQHQVKIVQAILIGLGAEFRSAPGGLVQMHLLGVEVLSDKLDLSLFTGWASAASLAADRLTQPQPTKGAA